MKRSTLTRVGLALAAGALPLLTATQASPAAAATATAAAAPTYTGRVVAATGLAQRTAPSTHVGASGKAFPRGSVLTLDCQLNGTAVGGNQRWYKVHGRDAWVAARYVANVGAAPVACTAGDWAYEVTVGTNVRQGPSTLDKKIGSFARGTEVGTRWVAKHGAAVGGNRKWVAVETPSGNRGWVSVTNLRLVG